MKAILKLVALILLPVFGSAQITLDTVSILNGQVKLLAPGKLKPVSDRMWEAKYQKRARPTMALSDENGEVNLIADLTQQRATESQLVSFKDFQIKQLKEKHPDLNLLSEGIKTVHNRKVGYFKFITQAADQKVFNYYFFVIMKEKILFFSFNCIAKRQKEWEGTADRIVSSLQML